MNKTEKESNLLASFNEYHFMELKENVDKIKNILNLKIHNYPDHEIFKTNYYVTTSGNYQIVIVNDDFKHIAKYTQNQKDNVEKQIAQLNIKFRFINEDLLKFQLDDYDSIERFLTNEKFLNIFEDLDGRLGHKAVLVIYKQL